MFVVLIAVSYVLWVMVCVVFVVVVMCFGMFWMGCFRCCLDVLGGERVFRGSACRRSFRSNRIEPNLANQKPE